MWSIEKGWYFHGLMLLERAWSCKEVIHCHFIVADYVKSWFKELTDKSMWCHYAITASTGSRLADWWISRGVDSWNIEHPQRMDWRLIRVETLMCQSDWEPGCHLVTVTSPHFEYHNSLNDMKMVFKKLKKFKKQTIHLWPSPMLLAQTLNQHLQYLQS